MLTPMELEPSLLGADTATALGRDLTDEQLVARIVAGEAACFEVFVRRFNSRLFRVARAIVKDDAIAEDVMQETYLSAFTHLHQFQGRSALSTWLTRIAVNEALARKRRMQRDAPATDDVDVAEDADPDALFDPEVAVHRGEVLSMVSTLVDALPEPLRVVFVLRAVEGMSVAEAAAVLDLSEENVKVRLFRARALLRTRMSEAFDDATGEVFSFHLVRCDRVVLGVLRGLARRGVAVAPAAQAEA
jgi:RNA polymerase sigma-70 factor (ECF subfamily)